MPQKLNVNKLPNTSMTFYLNFLIKKIISQIKTENGMYLTELCTIFVK